MEVAEALLFVEDRRNNGEALQRPIALVMLRA